MAGTAYHMEALRKTRVIERKTEAMRKMKESLGQPGETTNIQNTQSAPLVFSEAGHYAQNSPDKERIRHRRCRALNEGEDRVMPLMHPPEYNFCLSQNELPPRKPHFKV